MIKHFAISRRNSSAALLMVRTTSARSNFLFGHRAVHSNDTSQLTPCRQMRLIGFIPGPALSSTSDCPVCSKDARLFDGMPGRLSGHARSQMNLDLYWKSVQLTFSS